MVSPEGLQLIPVGMPLKRAFQISESPQNYWLPFGFEPHQKPTWSRVKIQVVPPNPHSMVLKWGLHLPQIGSHWFGPTATSKKRHPTGTARHVKQRVTTWKFSATCRISTSSCGRTVVGTCWHIYSQLAYPINDQLEVCLVHQRASTSL